MNSSVTAPRLPGKPFRKGQSGNPKGRPAVSRDFRVRCRSFMEREGWDLLEQMARKGRFQAEALRLVAAYAYGKPSRQLHATEEIRQKGIVLTIGGTEEEYIEGLRAVRRGAE